MIKFATIIVAVLLLAQVRVSEQQEVTAVITCTTTEFMAKLNVPDATANKPKLFFFDGKQSTDNCFGNVVASNDAADTYEATLGPLTSKNGGACGVNVNNGEWSYGIMYATISTDGTMHTGGGDVKFAAGSCSLNPSGTGSKTIDVKPVFTSGSATVFPGVIVGSVKLVNERGEDLAQGTVGTPAKLRVPITVKDIAVCKVNTVTLKPTSDATTESKPTANGCIGASPRYPATPTSLVPVPNSGAVDIDCFFIPVLWNTGTDGAFASQPSQLFVQCEFQCCKATGAPCVKSTGCGIKRKRRSVDNDALFVNVNTTITVVEDKLKKQEAEPCSGYTSNTVFYVVVVVLAVLLVITIGVAAYFGTRARVLFAGKDNPVFG